MKPRHVGFMLLDVMFAIGLLAAMIAILAVLATQHRGAQRALAQQRELTRIAERALAELHYRSDLAARPLNLPQYVRLTIHPLEGADDLPVPGHRWVVVAAAEDTKSVRLIGLVPAAHLPETSP